MANLETIRKRLEQHILEQGRTFRCVSLKIGRKDSYIQQYIKYGFPKRLNEVDRKKICQLLNINEEELIDDELTQNNINPPKLPNMDEECLNTEDFITIDIYEPRPNTNFEKCITGRMALNYKEFPSICGTTPHNLRMLRINTDNMSPTLATNSLITYDTGISEYTGDGIYVIEQDNFVQIKRIQRANNKLYIIKNDNPHYQDVECPASMLKIIGKAITCLTTQAL